MPITLSQILAALPKLNQADLEAIQATAQTLINGRTAVSGKSATTVSLAVFNALQGAIGLNNAYAAIAPTKWGKQFEKQVPILIEYLNLNFKGWDKNKVVQTAFLSMIFELLVADIRKRHFGLNGVGFGTAVLNMGQIPRVIDDAYPDYRENGMLGMVLKQFQGK